MRLTFTILIIFLLSAFSGDGQSTNYKSDFTPYFLKSRNVDFSFKDTTIEASIVTLPTGEFYFRYGHNFLTSNYSTYRLMGKGKNQTSVKDSLIKSDKPPLIMGSYFPMLFQDSTKVLIDPGYDYHWNPHCGYEFTYTYILSAAGFAPLYGTERDSTLRLVVTELGVDKAIYMIYSIDLSGENFRIHQKKIQHTTDETFKILEENEGELVREKMIRKFYAEFEKYNFNDSTYFVKFDGSSNYLVEFKTRNKYVALLRPHVNERGIGVDNKMSWILYDVVGSANQENRKKAKREKKK